MVADGRSLENQKVIERNSLSILAVSAVAQALTPS